MYMYSVQVNPKNKFQGVFDKIITGLQEDIFRQPFQVLTQELYVHVRLFLVFLP